MNAITLAARKGGVGGEHLDHACRRLRAPDGGRCMIVDADLRGSLTLAGGAGGNPRRHQGGNSGVTGIVRSRRRAGDGFDRARPQHALCRGDQRRSGQARGQGSAGSRPVPRPGRASVRPGLVGPDQPARGVSRLARWRCERRRKQQRWPPASWRLPGCGRRSTARSNAINGAQVDAVQSGLT
jgi:hypothetical protein